MGKLSAEEKPVEKEEEQAWAKEVEIDGVTYFFLPIDLGIKYADKIKSGFFVPLNETKRVRIEIGEDDLKGKLSTYKEKGLKNILFATEDYYLFLKNIKRGLTGFFTKDDEASGKLLNLTQILFLLSKASTYIGLPEEVPKNTEEFVVKALNILKGSKELNNYLKAFQKNNQDQFIVNLLVGYTACGLVDTMSWPAHIKEKVIQAVILGDITLNEEDYFKFIASNGDRTQWTKGFFNHPLVASKLLTKYFSNTISREVVRAVEQHHERPDGSGFPQALKGLSIDQLSAIIIVARSFIEALVESDFSYDDREKFIDDLLAERFDYNNFKQPCKALYIVMGIEKEQK